MLAADQWDVQEVVERIVAELQARKYLVWFDRKCVTRVHSCLDSTCVTVLTDRAASYSGVHEGQCDGG